MYQIEEMVLYGVHGVCRIVAIETMKFGRTRGKYYSLQPLDHPGARFYVPTDNDTASAKMKPLMSRPELLDLLKSPDIRQDLWIDEENIRKMKYRELIARADRTELLSLVYTLYKHKKLMLESGRKFHLSDETFLHDAQKMLSGEFTVVLDMAPTDTYNLLVGELGVGE